MTEPLHNDSSVSIPFELVGMTSLDRNYREVINLLFILPGLCSNILGTEKLLQFWEQYILDVSRHEEVNSSKCRVPQISEMFARLWQN